MEYQTYTKRYDTVMWSTTEYGQLSGEHFPVYIIGRKEGNVLFNDPLNTFSYGYIASDIWATLSE